MACLHLETDGRRCTQCLFTFRTSRHPEFKSWCGRPVTLSAAAACPRICAIGLWNREGYNDLDPSLPTTTTRWPLVHGPIRKCLTMPDTCPKGTRGLLLSPPRVLGLGVFTIFSFTQEGDSIPASPSPYLLHDTRASKFLALLAKAGNPNTLWLCICYPELGQRVASWEGHHAAPSAGSRARQSKAERAGPMTAEPV
jgi:hypothetical protein